MVSCPDAGCFIGNGGAADVGAVPSEISSGSVLQDPSRSVFRERPGVGFGSVAPGQTACRGLGIGCHNRLGCSHACGLQNLVGKALSALIDGDGDEDGVVVVVTDIPVLKFRVTASRPVHVLIAGGVSVFQHPFGVEGGIALAIRMEHHANLGGFAALGGQDIVRAVPFEVLTVLRDDVVLPQPRTVIHQFPGALRRGGGCVCHGGDVGSRCRTVEIFVSERDAVVVGFCGGGDERHGSRFRMFGNALCQFSVGGIGFQNREAAVCFLLSDRREIIA